MVDISPRQMVKIEMGQAYPSLDTFKKIAGALGVSIQSLFENEYFDSIQNLKNEIHKKVDVLDEKLIRFLYLIISNLY